MQVPDAKIPELASSPNIANDLYILVSVDMPTNFIENHRLVYDQAIKETAAMPRIKVAILDTGLDMTHPTIQASASQDRIKDVRSWLPLSRTTGGGDLSGHGTHVTALLLDIAQIADLQPISPDEIAKVIEDSPLNIQNRVGLTP